MSKLLIQHAVEFGTPTPAPVAPAPPQWDSQPNPVFDEGVASIYDLNTLVSDPNNDPLTVTLNDGPDRTNEMLWSQEITESAWNTSASNNQQDATTAPDDTLTADKLQVDGAGGAAECYVRQLRTLSLATQYCLSVYVKPAEKTWIALSTITFTVPGNTTQYFDVQNGVAGADAGFDNYGIEAAANGFYRVWIVFTLGGADATGWVTISLADSDGDKVVGRNGLDGAYLWGAQLEEGDAPTAYIATTTTPVTEPGAANLPSGVTFANGVLTYDGVGGVATESGLVANVSDGTENADSNPFSVQIQAVVGNRAPVWAGTPQPNFTQGTAGTYSLNPFVSDADNDPLTITLDQSYAANGITIAGGIISYDGIGGIATLTNVVATADDGTTTANSVPFTINIAAAGSQDVDMDNWPFVSCAFSLGNIVDRITNDPAAKIISYNNFFISQALYLGDSTNRLAQRNRFDALWATNSELHIIIHVDYLTVSFDIQGTFKSERWLETKIFNTIQNNDDIFLREFASGPYIVHENSTGDGFAFNWGCSNASMQTIVEGELEQWTDFDGANGLINNGRPVSWMQDTIPLFDFRYSRSARSGATGNVIKSVVNSTTLQIDNLDRVTPAICDIASATGGNFAPMLRSMQIVVVKADGSGGDWAEITGMREINATTWEIQLANSLENISVAPGDDYACHGKASSTNSLRLFGSSNSGELTQAQWRAGIKNFVNRFRDTVQTNYAESVGGYVNMGARNLTNYLNGTFDTNPNEDTGLWDGMHFERCGQVCGFFQGNQANYFTNRQNDIGGSAGGNNWNPDRMVLGHEWNKLHLNSNAASHNNYPCIWMNAQVRSLGADQGNYFAGWSELDAAYARFWALASWCTENVCPQIEADEGHDVPFWLDEQMVYAGNPVTDRSTVWGTVDIANKTVTYSPDFGTHGFVVKFDNVWIIINLRKPDSDPWRPHWLSGGQSLNTSLDQWTVSGLGAGKKLVHFNPLGYVHPGPGKFTGLSPTFFDDVDPGRDTIINNPTRGPQTGGGYANGDTVDCGALEAFLLFPVDV